MSRARVMVEICFDQKKSKKKKINGDNTKYIVLLKPIKPPTACQSVEEYTNKTI